MVFMNKPKPKSRENVLSPEEREKLCKVCQTDREKFVIYGLLYTGMREGEFLHMRKSWIDFKGGIINIPHKDICKICLTCKKSKMRKGKLIKDANIWQGKTVHAQRPIPIVPEIKDMLDEFFSKYNSVIDVYWYRQNLWKIVKEVGARSKIKHSVFPHCLRATFATMLVEKGMDNPVKLKDIMGWKKLEQSTDYIRLGGASMKRALDDIW